MTTIRLSFEANLGRNCEKSKVVHLNGDFYCLKKLRDLRVHRVVKHGVATQVNDEERMKGLEEAQNDADHWREWYCLTPLERWHESMMLWQFFLGIGGSLDPDPDPQSPFDAFMPKGLAPAYGGGNLRVIRRGRV